MSAVMRSVRGRRDMMFWIMRPVMCLHWRRRDIMLPSVSMTIFLRRSGGFTPLRSWRLMLVLEPYAKLDIIKFYASLRERRAGHGQGSNHQRR